MKRIPFVFLICLVLYALGYGQHPRGPNTNLIGTNWTMYYTECGRTRWEKYREVTFLSGGAIKDSHGSWRLTGNKLHMDIFDDPIVTGMEAVVAGNQINGTASISTGHPITLCVRLARDSKPASPARGDGFAAFYATFKRAVLSNDRAAVRNMMSPVFLVALGDEESPDQALRNLGVEGWQQLRLAVNRFPVRGPRGYHLADHHLGTLVFIVEDGKWEWKGLQGD